MEVENVGEKGGQNEREGGEERCERRIQREQEYACA